MGPLVLAAIGSGALRAGAGIFGARRAAKRQRRFIHEAYTLGKQRMDLQQQDVRQGQAEGLIARGLGGGGGLRAGGGVSAAVQPGALPSLTGARDLGGQLMLDQRREQGLEQNQLRRERNRALADVKAGANQAVVDSIGAGVQTGLQVYGMGQQLGAMRAAKAPGPVGQAVGGGTPVAGSPADFDTPWGGIDPVDPLRRGAWATPSAGTFNVYDQTRGVG